MRLQQTLEKYIPLIGNMLAPAFVFAAGLFIFLSKGNLAFENAVVLHWMFYGLNLVCLIVLLNFNRGRLLFFMGSAAVAYMIINYIKSRFGEIFATTVWYQNLTVVLPVNLLVFYLYSSRRFFSRQSLVMLLALIAEYTFIEILGRKNFAITIILNGYNLISFGMFAVLWCSALTRAVKSGKLLDYSVLFASISIFCGIFYADLPSGLSLFFCIAQLILTGCLVYRLVYSYYYDEVTGFFSRRSYLKQSEKFPLKYSLGIVNIDCYDKLAIVIGQKKLNTVVELIAEILENMAAGENIYRYTPELFIILYKKLDKKEVFAELEKIRRTIAVLGFEYDQGKKPVNLTVSCSVSEKKRSDANAAEVLMRAEKAMRKTLKFSHNVTSQG